MPTARPLRDVFAEVTAHDGAAGAAQAAGASGAATASGVDPADLLAAHGHPDLSDSLVAEAVIGYADTAPLEVAEHLAPYVMAHSAVPLADVADLDVDSSRWFDLLASAPIPGLVELDLDPTDLDPTDLDPTDLDPTDLDQTTGDPAGLDPTAELDSDLSLTASPPSGDPDGGDLAGEDAGLDFGLGSRYEQDLLPDADRPPDTVSGPETSVVAATMGAGITHEVGRNDGLLAPAEVPDVSTVVDEVAGVGATVIDETADGSPAEADGGNHIPDA